MQPYQFLKDRPLDEVKKFHTHVSDNIRRSNRFNWLRGMLPTWVEGKRIAEQILGINGKHEVIRIMK